MEAAINVPQKHNLLRQRNLNMLNLPLVVSWEKTFFCVCKHGNSRKDHRHVHDLCAEIALYVQKACFESFSATIG